MESDFVIKNHLDSVNTSNDPSMFEILNRYSRQPEDDSPQPSKNAPSRTVSGTDGLRISAGPDVIRWVILLVVVLIIVTLLLKKGKKSKISKRMKRIEKELISMREAYKK